MSDKELKNLRTLQEVELENIKTIAEICEANDIRYFLIGGSLIGALRHHGFIPWDDDVDIGMPRPDYNKFVKIAKPHLANYYELKLMGENGTRSWAVLYNNRKKFYVNTEDKTRSAMGAFVDIFPIDGFPKVKIRRSMYYLDFLFWEMLYKFTKIDCVWTGIERPFYKEILIKFAGYVHIGNLLSSEKVQNKFDKVMQKYDYNDAQYVGNLCGRYGKKEIVPKYQLSGNRIAKFEGLDVHIPEGAEDYLTSIYGDWRKLPPPEQRKGHPIEFAN